MLGILKEAAFNWFAFTALLEPLFRNRGYGWLVLDEFLLEFTSQLAHLGLTEEEMRLTEESRVAYLATLKQKESDMNNLLALSDSSDESDFEELESAEKDQSIKEKLEKIKDKHRKRMKTDVQIKRLLRKKVTKSTKNNFA